MVVGYHTDLDKFNARVEEDAIQFKPYGQKIASYKRSLSSKGKGKASVPEAELNEDDEDVVTFEVYHVSVSFSLESTVSQSKLSRQHGTLQAL